MRDFQKSRLQEGVIGREFGQRANRDFLNNLTTLYIDLGEG